MLTDFLRQVVPANSIICLARQRAQANATIGRPRLHFNNSFFTLAELSVAENVVNEWNRLQDTDVYFSPAGYKTKASRKKTNVSQLQSLCIDVDIKDVDGHWSTKSEALRSLKRLCKALPVLPPPLVVDSGGGYHVYFRIAEPLSVAHWQPLANAFRDKVQQLEPELIADPKRTIDAAGVLRLPGTYNVKIKGAPREVKVVVNGAGQASYESLMEALGGIPASGLALPPDYAKGPNTFAIGNPYRREFIDIEPRPVLTQCAQMRHHLETKGAVSEPEWLLACRVYTCLRDGNSIAHKFSNPAFRDMIDRKLLHASKNFDAPSTACKEWPKQERCKGCRWAGRVLFPVEISELATAQREATEQRALAVTEAAQVAVQQIHRAALPTGYLQLRAAYEQVLTDEGLEYTHVPGVRKDNPQETMPLIRGHINVKYTSSERTTTGWVDMRVHVDVILHQRNTEVVVPVRDLTSERLDTATRALRDCGMTFDAETIPKKKALLRMFAHIVDVASTLIVPYYPNKGWDGNYPWGSQPLNVGAMRYTPAGVVERGCNRAEHIGGANQAKSIVEAFCSGVPRGTLGAWQRGMEIYNRPGMELAQMLMLSGMGNLLLPLISQAPGGILLALTGAAGIGKTTLLRFLASFVGDPAESMVPGSSTSNALVNMLSQAGFLLLPVDDSFKMDAPALSLLLTSVSSGMEKARMSGTVETGWVSEMGAKFNSSLVVTTNFDIGTIIGSGRSHEAQMMSDAARSRLLEIPASHIHIPKDVTQKMWSVAEAKVLDNFGHALDVFARYVSTRQAAISHELRAVETRVHATLVRHAPVAARGVLRFWSKYLACVYVAGKVVTIHRPILTWDINAILKAGMQLTLEHDEEAKIDQEEILEQLWSILLNDQNGKLRINRSYMTAKGRGGWPEWNVSNAGAVGRARGGLRQWDDSVTGHQLIRGQTVPGTSLITLGLVPDWRVILTKVVDENGRTIHYEREVLITLTTLDALIGRAGGRELKVSDWLELHAAFVLNGVVEGVKPSAAKRYDLSNPCRTPIDTRAGFKGQRRRCVRLVFPPLSPDEVEPA